MEDIFITIDNHSFIPQNVRIKVGDTIHWQNEDEEAHSIHSGYDFNSNILENGDNYSYQFQDVGTYDYECGVHPDMKGEIIVEEV